MQPGPCSLGAVVEAGWRQAGGRLEAGWRQAAWASGERSGRRTGAASELSCSLGAVVQPVSLGAVVQPARVQPARMQPARMPPARKMGRPSAFLHRLNRLQAGGRLEAGWRHHLGICNFLANRAAWELSCRLEASLRDLLLFGQPCSLGAVVQPGWRQAGGRLEAGWRHHLRIYSFLADRAAWASGERSGRPQVFGE